MGIVCIVWCAIATEFFNRAPAGRFKALRVLADKLEYEKVTHSS